MAIGYTPTTWVDNDTLVDAARLNNIEAALKAACDALDEFYDAVNKIMNIPGDVNIQKQSAEIDIGTSSIWIGLTAYLSFTRLNMQNGANFSAGDINDVLANEFTLQNYGGDIILQNLYNAGLAHGDIKLLTDGQALYNGVEIATKAEVTPSGIDLNTLTKEGKYQTYNAINLPSGVSGFATVDVVPFNNDTAYPRQILYPLRSHDIYVRYYNADTWSSWDKIATKSDLSNSIDISSHFSAASSAISEIEAYAIGNIVSLRMTVRPYGILNASTWYDVVNISDYVPISITAMEVAQGNNGNVPQTISAILKSTGIISLNIGTGTYTSGQYFILSATYICS